MREVCFGVEQELLEILRDVRVEVSKVCDIDVVCVYVWVQEDLLEERNVVTLIVELDYRKE